ncbi:hypothetical protein D3C71_1828730 [compost metagenome]
MRAKAITLIADQLLHSRQPLADPVADPLDHLGFVMPQLPQPVEYTDVVQRMHIAANQRRHATLAGAGNEVFGQQRHLWITFLQVLDDRR